MHQQVIIQVLDKAKGSPAMTKTISFETDRTQAETLALFGPQLRQLLRAKQAQVLAAIK